MKICYLTNEYPIAGRHAGGIGTYLKNVAETLVKKGHDVHVVYCDGRVAEQRILVLNGVTIHMVLVTRSVFERYNHSRFINRFKLNMIADHAWGMARHLSIAKSLADYIEDNVQADIYEAQEIGFLAYFLSKRVKNIVIKLHTPFLYLSVLNRIYIPKYFFMNIFECLTARRSAHISAPSRSIRKKISKAWRIPSERISVEPYPFTFATMDRDPSRVPEGKYILYFGRIERRKGVFLLAKSIKELVRKDPRLKFVFVGDDNWYGFRNRNSTKAKVIRALGTAAMNVHWIDSLAPGQLYPVIEKASFVVLPSLWENFPNVGLESMAFGKTVIAPRDTGFEEQIEDMKSGILFTRKSVKDLTEKILYAINHPLEVERIGHAARERVRDFDAGRMTDAIWDMYRRVLEMPDKRTALQQSIYRFTLYLRYQFIKQKKADPIFIIFTPRTGSTLLSSLFDSVPEVKARTFSEYNEILNTINWLGIPAGSREKSLTHIRYSVTRGPKVGVYRISIEQLLQHKITIADILNLFPGSRFIILFRESLADQFLSLRQAQITKQWRLMMGDSSVALKEKIKIDKGSLLYFYQETRFKYQKILQEECLKDRSISISYEELVKDPQRLFDEKLSPFCGISRAVISTATRKQSTSTQTDIVENYDEIKGFLNGAISKFDYSFQPIFVLFTALSGSAVLTDCINLMGLGVMSDEVLNPNDPRGLRPSTKEKALDHIRDALYDPQACPHGPLGVSISLDHLRLHQLTTQDLVSNFPTAKFLVLYRESLSDQYLSILQNRELQGRFLLIEKEELVKNPQRLFDDKVFPFLKIQRATVSFRIREQTAEPPAEIVENYAEVKDILEGEITKFYDTLEPIFILFTARTGSTLFNDYIRSTGRVPMGYEVLNPTDPWGCPPSTKQEALQHILYYLSYPSVTTRKRPWGVRISLYHLKLHQLTIQDLLKSFPSAKFIVLYRSSLSDQYLSLLHAQLTNQWSLMGGESPAVLKEKMTIDKGSLLHFYQETRLSYERIMHAEGLQDRTLIVRYEDLMKDPQRFFNDIVFPFLRILRTVISTRTRKRIQGSHADLVENYDEVKDLLTGDISRQEYTL